MIEFERGETAQIGGNVRLGADEFAETGELVGAEFVWLDHLRSLPVETLGIGIVGPEVGAARTLRGRSDAVFPIVTVGEAAAWPADDGRMDLLHPLDQLGANAVLVADFGVFAHPYAVVYDSADVLGEMAIDVGRNRALGLTGEDLDASIRGPRPGGFARKGECRTG